MSGPHFDPVNYKQTAMRNWDGVARLYHDSWASIARGPFQVTSELVSAAHIRSNDRVLDVACGTGIVSAEAEKWFGPKGQLVGIDTSYGALTIARKACPSGLFLQMDAEQLGLRGMFDHIFCQFGLMFFPRAQNVLSVLHSLTRDGGRIAIAVHGTPEKVPYFSAIMEPVAELIPDIRLPGTPTVHLYGNPADLKKVIEDAGFRETSLTQRTYYYFAGSFEELWSEFLATTAYSIRTRIEADPAIFSAIKESAQSRAKSHNNDGVISFPWEVIIAQAHN